MERLKLSYRVLAFDFVCPSLEYITLHKEIPEKTSGHKVLIFAVLFFKKKKKKERKIVA